MLSYSRRHVFFWFIFVENGLPLGPHPRATFGPDEQIKTQKNKKANDQNWNEPYV